MKKIILSKITNFIVAISVVCLNISTLPAKSHSKHSEDHHFRISAIGITSDGGHQHSSGNDEQKSKMKSLSEKIKSVDGFDETATLLGQLLPNLAGPIAAGSILTLATPLVWLGVSGMLSEYRQARHEFIEISEGKESVGEKLQILAGSSRKWQNYLNNKFGLEYEIDPIEIPEEKSPEEIAATLVAYQALNNELFVKSLAVKYGWTGIAGMAGMLGGMILGASAAAFEVAVDLGAGSGILEAAATAFEISAGSFFIPAQAFMTAYALNRKKQGKRAISILNKAKSSFQEDNDKGLSKETSEHVLSLIEKQKRFIKVHSIQYGNLTAVGQGFMVTGTALGLSGVGIVGTAPAFLVGAPLTIGPAIKRIIYSEKEKKFKGSESQFVDQKLKLRDPLAILTICENSFLCANKQLEKEFTETTNSLAMIKSLSLISHVANDKKLFKKTTRAKFEKLEKLLKKDSESLKGSELEPAIIDKVKNIFSNNQMKILSFIEEDSKQRNKKLLKSMVSVLVGDFISSKESLFSNNNSSLTKVEKKSLEQIGINYDILEKNSEEPSKKEVKKLVMESIKRGKLALKAIRFRLADSMVGLSQIKKMALEIQGI